MRDLSLSSLIPASVLAFVNSNAGGKLYICTTPQPTDVADAAAYAALTWVQIKGVGNHGETGSNTNILSYNTWDTSVIQKTKGMTDAGSPEIELARSGTDAGQVALRAAAKTNLPHAFKIERNDKPNSNVGSKPTTIYNRGVVAGPRTPNGRNEDFDLEIYVLGLTQEQIIVELVTA